MINPREVHNTGRYEDMKLVQGIMPLSYPALFSHVRVAKNGVAAMSHTPVTLYTSHMQISRQQYRYTLNTADGQCRVLRGVAHKSFIMDWQMDTSAMCKHLPRDTGQCGSSASPTPLPVRDNVGMLELVGDKLLNAAACRLPDSRCLSGRRTSCLGIFEH
ncbi:hypothetical protein BDW71DRAFT_57715 [Aspergillus fruticulosus]